MDFAQQAVRQAAGIVKARYGTTDLAIHSKGPNDVVTAADFAV
jgi:fructose-1,6-bisphosphatase/inositol monophosphatase family enzyme